MATIKRISGIEMLEELRYEGDRATGKLNHFLKVESNGTVVYFNEDTFDLNEGTVYVVLKNADQTEGRGPMRFYAVFASYDDAVSYIMSQPGIYGSKQGISNYPGVNIHGTPYVVSGFNGYEIKATKLL